MALPRLTAAALLLFLGAAAPSHARLDDAVLLNIEASRVPLGSKADITKLPAAADDAPVDMTFLGCLRLRATGRNAELFGGISGAYLNGSRMMLVSDTTPTDPAPGMSPEDEDSLWGAGRLFVMDVRFAGGGGEGEGILPVGIENASVRLLRDRFGDVVKHDYFRGDTESLDVEWPAALLVGVEETHVVRRYKFLTPASGNSIDVQVGTPTLLGNHGKDLVKLSGAGAKIRKCTAEGGNNGAEGLALMSKDKVLVFCEHSRPGGPKDSTVGWLANSHTGTVLGNYRLTLPRVEGVEDTFYRLSGISSVPGTSDAVFLFHFWSWKTGNLVKLGRATLVRAELRSDDPHAPGSDAHPIKVAPTELVDLKEREGYNVDNFEAVLVNPAGAPGSYTVHLLSDNNFNEKHQRTLMLSMMMKDRPGQKVFTTSLSKATEQAFADRDALMPTPGSRAAVHRAAGALLSGVALCVLLAVMFHARRGADRPSQNFMLVEELDDRLVE